MFIFRLLSPKLFLILIIVLFLITRLYKISDIPPSLYWDEASIAYNAYSVSKDGVDEWGNFLPLHFRAFGEFKLPVFIYSTIPFIKIFGLNEIAVRLPAVLFSLGSMLITYLLAKKLSGSKAVGLWSSFFITISPWFFIFSRTGYEVTAGLMFYLLGLYVFLALSNSWSILLLTLCFILSAYSYNSFRVIAPLTVLILILFQKDNLGQLFKKQVVAILLSLVILIVALIPVYRLYKYDAGASRLQLLGSSFELVAPNYLSHFNPVFLFLEGDKNLRHQQSSFGQLNILGLILIPLGLFALVKKRNLWFLLPLILIAPIPAAITKESPHALRSILFIPLLCMVSALGVTEFGRFIKNKYLVSGIVIIISLLFFSYYFFQFIKNYPVQSSKEWQTGYKNIFVDYKSQFPNFDQVIISDQYAQPYIFGLYYLKYDPNKFREQVKRNEVSHWGVSTVQGFDNFVFKKINIDEIPKGKSLIFATPDDKLTTLLHKNVILNLDKSIAFYVYEYEK